MVKEKRVLPADVYDALELSVIAHHGIGQPNVFTDAERFGEGPTKGCPVCILGHSAFVTDKNTPYNEVSDKLFQVGIRGSYSDEIVRAINARKKVSQYARVSWKEYTRELNIVRGDS